MHTCADLPILFCIDLPILKKKLPVKQFYPFELLLAPLSKKYEGMGYKHFPGDTSGQCHLFLYPTGWFLNFIVFFAVLPSMTLFFISPGLTVIYFIIYIVTYRFLFLYHRKPILDILWHKWLPVYDTYVTDVPQLTIYKPKFKFITFLTWPARRHIWYRQPVNWSNGSQQECFLAMAIFDRLNLKGNVQQPTLWGWEEVKVVLFIYFPVWCSYLLLLFGLCLHFIPLYKKAGWFTHDNPFSLKMFMVSGLIWAILAFWFSMRMKRFLEMFEFNHNSFDLRNLIKRWLPVRIYNEPELIELLRFDPRNHLIAIKIINFVQVGIITIYILLIRVAGTIG